MTAKHRTPTSYVDERLHAGAGIVDAASALTWRGFMFEGRGWRPAPGCEGYFEYFCTELQATAKRYGPSVWIGSIGPGPTTNSATFEGLCVAAVHALEQQQSYGARVLTRLQPAPASAWLDAFRVTLLGAP